MDKKNIYTILFAILGVILLAGMTIYSVRVISSDESLVSLRAAFKGKGHGPKKPQEEPPGVIAKQRKTTLSFMPLSGQQRVDQKFEVKVILATQDQAVYGADVLITYDPAILELAPIGQADPLVGNRIVKQWGEGEILFSYLAPAGTTWQDEVVLAILGLTPKKVGPADLKFVFDQSLDFDCNVAGSEGKDILKRVDDAHFDIIE